MCTRHSIITNQSELFKEYPKKNIIPYKVNYNVAITQETPVITAGEPDLIQPIHFGLVPPFADSTALQGDTWNARDDRLMQSNLWKPLMEKGQTCLILTNGFYEWKDTGSGKFNESLPYRFKLRDRDMFAFAGLWAEWKNEQTDEIYRSYAVITTKANRLVGEIHPLHRMPFIPDAEQARIWIDNATSLKEKLKLIATYPEELMERYPISKAINKAMVNKKPNNSPSLIRPLDVIQGSLF